MPVHDRMGFKIAPREIGQRTRRKLPLVQPKEKEMGNLGGRLHVRTCHQLKQRDKSRIRDALYPSTSKHLFDLLIVNPIAGQQTRNSLSASVGLINFECAEQDRFRTRPVVASRLVKKSPCALLVADTPSRDIEHEPLCAIIAHSELPNELSKMATFIKGAKVMPKPSGLRGFDG